MSSRYRQTDDWSENDEGCDPVSDGTSGQEDHVTVIRSDMKPETCDHIMLGYEARDLISSRDRSYLL